MNTEPSSPGEPIPIQPSRILLTIILSSHSLAILALLLADLSWILKAFLAMAVVLHAGYSYQRYYSLQHRDSVLEVMRGSNGWSLLLAGGSSIPAELGPVLITSFFTLLNFKSTQGGRKYAVLLFPDTTDQQLIRRLRGRLRYGLMQSESRSD
jgi:hypothetical protein|tara:strand:- start:14333 stop:14791 length:459 start_codon:yes stop_codon:yes gene_type:complete